MKIIKELAEFGIVFLMFTVGLEFSQPKLFALKRSVFLVGGLQVLFSIVITSWIGMFFGMNLMDALVIGGIVAMSSTAMVVKQLHDQLELQTPHGMNAVGILLFQDLAVIPFIILISGLAKYSETSFSLIFLWALLKGFIAIVLIISLGRWVLRPVFHLIAKTRTSELFTMAALLVILTTAWLTHAMDLSFALGAFLGGMMLAETEFRHQIEAEIRPFRDLLLGLFFITIGMLVNIASWYETWIWIGLLLIALVLGKMLLILLISYLSGLNYTESLRTGLILAQGSEFGFAILAFALSNSLLPLDYGQVVLAALAISIIISPLLIHFNKAIANFLFPRISKMDSAVTQKEIEKITAEFKQHIIICGYGRVGQHIARLLTKIKFPYIGLDIDANLVEAGNLAGDEVIYGDASHPQILKAVGLQHAKAVVISFNDIRTAIKIIGIVRQEHMTLPILVRCKDEIELMELKKYGATRIIAEIFEESLTLSHHLFQLLQIPPRKISKLMKEVRNKDYGLLRKIFPHSLSLTEDIEIESSLHEQLRPILIYETAYAINQALGAFNFKEMGVEVVAIRRKNKSLKPRKNLVFKANDIIILYGAFINLENAEQVLLEGI
jgi:CPA2 family monovalent cation:H+ antiporter-2